MSFPPYTVFCTTPDCRRPAVYKVAARWSDGSTTELKTYALCCAECLPDAFARAAVKRAGCRLAPGETLDPPGIYELQRGGRDRDLKRRHDLEQLLGTAPGPQP